MFNIKLNVDKKFVLEWFTFFFFLNVIGKHNLIELDLILGHLTRTHPLPLS